MEFNDYSDGAGKRFACLLLDDVLRMEEERKLSEEVFFSSAHATGKGIDYLTSPERVRGLSRIPKDINQNSVRVAKMYGAGVLFPFLTVHADNMLMLFNSDDKATGRASIVEVLKANLASDRQNMKDRLLGFIGGRGE